MKKKRFRFIEMIIPCTFRTNYKMNINLFDSIKSAVFKYFRLLSVTYAVSWEEWWTYDGISGKSYYV